MAKHDEIKFLIHQSNLIEGFDDGAMDLNSLAAWKCLLKRPIDGLTHTAIRNTQRRILHSQNAPQCYKGRYRSKPFEKVWIAGRPGSDPLHVLVDMHKWLAKVKDAEPIPHHIQFERIHPFLDGNGRTGRLLMWWMEQHLDLPLTHVTYEDRMEYYKWFR